MRLGGRGVVVMVALSIAAVGLGPAAAPAVAADVDPAACFVTGTLRAAPGVTTVVTPQSLSGSLILNCLSTGDDAGTWSLSLVGSATSGGCFIISGAGAWSGTTPEGATTSGTFTVSQSGPNGPIAITGGLDTAGETHSLSLALAGTPSPVCPTAPTTSYSLTGSASITETADADAVDCTASGSMTVTPGLSALAVTVVYGGTVNLNCLGQSDDSGGWSITFSGSGTSAGCALAGTSSGTFGGASPEGSVTGAFTLTESGPNGPLALTGTVVAGSESHSIAAALAPVFTPVCPPSSTSATLSGSATLAE